MSKINIVAKFKSKPECKAELLEILHKVIDDSRKEEGCVQYDLHVDSKDDLKFILIEIWRSQHDIDLHCETAHFKLLMKEFENKVVDFTIDVMNKIY